MRLTLKRCANGIPIKLCMAVCMACLFGYGNLWGQNGMSLGEMWKQRNSTENPSGLEFGKWETVLPDGKGAALGPVLGMQTVHVLLLPSGKILMSSGSSWRNLKPIQTYPEFPNPASGQGLFDLRDDPFRNNKLNDYYQLVNNVGIYDPDSNTFFRIPHPRPVKDPEEECHFAPNDMFCTGHLQLPNGNPLFVGGTQYYFPFRTGARTSYIFDWRKELTIDWKREDWRPIRNDDDGYPWIFSGFMKRGRWYPSLVPLQDGRLVVFSGFVGFDRGFETMYQFEINHFVEFFDPAAFSPANPQAAWKSIDVSEIENSPFTTKIKEKPKSPVICPDVDFFEEWDLDTECDQLPCDCPERCVEAHQYDAFKLYPQGYMFDQKRMFLSREGEWVSLRTADTWYMRRTKNTYWMNIEGTASEPEITFDPGPPRPDTITSYGTSLLDPNSGKVTILGGQKTSAGTLLPHNADSLTRFAGGLGSRKKEVFNYQGPGPTDGSWDMEKDFFGTQTQDDRTMHYALVLPTRQVLVLNGGNYDFYGPIHYPLLMTPRYNRNGEFIAYDQKRMNAAIEPRLYHNSALLLPDGRIWVSGGNNSRASVELGAYPAEPELVTSQPKPNLDLVDIDLYFFRDGPMAKTQKGMESTPTENWIAEIFSPPYLFIDPNRRANILGLEQAKPNPKIKFKEIIGEKEYYLLQSNQNYELELDELPRSTSKKNQGSLVLIKLPSVTHGWDSGQHFHELEMGKMNLSPNKGGNYKANVEFGTPDANAELLPPGFYMLFYVDANGKPTVAQMVRLDDQAIAP